MAWWLAGDGIRFESRSGQGGIRGGQLRSTVTKGGGRCSDGARSLRNCRKPARLSTSRVRLSECAEPAVKTAWPICLSGHRMATCFPLRRVASLTAGHGTTGKSRVTNLQPMVAVTAPHRETAAWAPPSLNVQKSTGAASMLAPGVSYETRGACYQQQQIAFAGLAKVFLAALVAELVLLLVLYEQFWAGGHHHWHLAALDHRSFHHPVADRCGAQHHGLDGA